LKYCVVPVGFIQAVADDVPVMEEQGLVVVVGLHVVEDGPADRLMVVRGAPERVVRSVSP